MPFPARIRRVEPVETETKGWIQTINNLKINIPLRRGGLDTCTCVLVQVYALRKLRSGLLDHLGLLKSKTVR